MSADATAKRSDAERTPDGKSLTLDGLRRRIAAIEGRAPGFETAVPAPEEAAWSLGAPAIDASLGAARRGIGTLHDLAPDAYMDAPAAAGFGLALLVRLVGGGAASRRAILWCQNATSGQESGLPYGPGLHPLGLAPERLVLVTAARDREVLWALEEGLHARGLAAVVGEIGGADFTATRRLALACAAAGLPCLLLRGHGDRRTSAAHTRWRIAARPSAPDVWDPQAPGRARWRLELLRCRGGRPGQWNVEWNGETGTFDLASPLVDRTVATRARIEGAGGPASQPWRRVG